MTVYGGIEAGGSKWECAVGTGPDDLHAAETIPTTTPEETIGRVVAFFEREGPVDAIGIGSFGPLDRKPSSPTWGFVTTTPKQGWAHTDVGQEIRRRLSVPVAFDTDVNAAALGEHRWGAAQGLDTFCYITVGTGIGGGGMVGGKLLDVFQEAAWELQARYLALGLVSVTCVLSPERIVLGGGVMARPGLLGLVQREVVTLMNGYLGSGTLGDQISGYVTLPRLGARAGVLGAIALADVAHRPASSDQVG
jgi:fructokinase